jgi:DtxR family Mn-dependent transcriptional regulator
MTLSRVVDGLSDGSNKPVEPRASEPQAELTSSLEDYLETIYVLVRDQKLARVKDIAKARGVRAGSVSPAMRRLAAMGLIDYAHREYIDLTPAGEQLARSIYARHQLLTRFFEQFLQMPSDEAKTNACAMEHSLSPQGMEHLVRFFEFLQVCPEGPEFLAKFHACSVVHEGSPKCSGSCKHKRSLNTLHRGLLTLWDLPPEKSARVAQVEAPAKERQALLDQGFLPGAVLRVMRRGADGKTLWIQLGGFDLHLDKEAAQAVLTIPTAD